MVGQRHPQISDVRPGHPNTPVTVKRCGNITEIRYAVHGPPEIAIEKLNTDMYVDKRTGEVKEFGPVYPEHPSCFLGDIGAQENHVAEILPGAVIEIDTVRSLDAY